MAVRSLCSTPQPFKIRLTIRIFCRKILTGSENPHWFYSTSILMRTARVTRLRLKRVQSGADFLIINFFAIIEQTLQEFDFFELIGVCFKYILIFLVGNR